MGSLSVVTRYRKSLMNIPLNMSDLTLPKSNIGNVDELAMDRKLLMWNSMKA